MRKPKLTPAEIRAYRELARAAQKLRAPKSGQRVGKPSRERGCPLPSNTIPDTGPELLNLPQMAARCGVSPRTAWGWATAGISPPPLRIGKGTVRYSGAAYADWVSRGCPTCNGGHGHE